MNVKILVFWKREPFSLCKWKQQYLRLEMDINNFQLLLSHHLREGDGLDVTESVKDKTYSCMSLVKMVWQTL